MADEYQLKAAYLYKFATLIEWPDDFTPVDNDAFVLGVFGPNPFGDLLERIAEAKKVRGKRIVIRRFRRVEEITTCHILFIARPEVADQDERIQALPLPQILDKTRNSATLLVSDTEGFAQRGVTINFFLEENKVLFEVNRRSADRRRLRISSKLLNIARLIDEEGAP